MHIRVTNFNLSLWWIQICVHSYLCECLFYVYMQYTRVSLCVCMRVLLFLSYCFCSFGFSSLQFANTLVLCHRAFFFLCQFTVFSSAFFSCYVQCSVFVSISDGNAAFFFILFLILSFHAHRLFFSLGLQFAFGDGPKRYTYQISVTHYLSPDFSESSGCLRSAFILGICMIINFFVNIELQLFLMYAHFTCLDFWLFLLCNLSIIFD